MQVGQTNQGLAGVPGATKSASSSQPGGAMGKDAFLKLLVTQMQYQDPMNPMDNTQFTAQLAQFTSLEQMFKMNDTLTGISSSQKTGDMANVVGFLDRQVTAMNDKVLVNGNNITPIHFNLSGDSSITNVAITDGTGQVVRTLSLDARAKGDNTTTWNGLDDQGGKVPDGTYTFGVAAQDRTGASVSSTPLVTGKVTGATYRNGAPLLIVGDQLISIQDVSEVRELPAAN